MAVIALPARHAAGTTARMDLSGLRYLLIAVVSAPLLAGAGAGAYAQDAGPVVAPETAQSAVPAGTEGAAPGAAQPAAATVQSCTKSDFETVVDEAAGSLRDLNQQNKPKLQEKLRQLKVKRGWSEDQFLKEAAPFVKDESVDAFDARTADLLGQITAMGDEGSAQKTPDCALFQTLRGHMNVLVETQNAKWTYMFGKIDAALGE